MAIIIIKRHFDKIVKHCVDSYPNEAGGFLGGLGGIVLGIFPVPNTAVFWGVEKVSFKWADWDIIKVTEFFNKYHMKLFGFYHSHPRTALPIPSHKDVATHRQMNLPVMMIVSLTDPKDTKVATFEVFPAFAKKKLAVVKDGSIGKYLREVLQKLELKRSASRYVQEITKLEGGVSNILSQKRAKPL